MVLVQGAMPLKPAFERAEWSLLIRAVLPFAAAVVIATLYLRMTVVLMSLLASGVQTGYYATSYRILEVLIAIPALTVGSTLPVLARAARDDHDRLGYVLGRLFEVMLIVGVWIGLALALGASFAIHVLAGNKSGPSVPVLQIQSLAIVTQFLAASWQYGLLSLHRHRPLLMISAGALVLSVVSTLILVPQLQAQGAAIAFMIVEVVVAVSSLVVLIRSAPGLVPPLRVPLRVTVAAALGASMFLIPGLTSLARALIASVIYFGVLVALRAIPPEVLQAVLRRPQFAKP
jgi:O-antigen/teichoic acid export membrane protein